MPTSSTKRFYESNPSAQFSELFERRTHLPAPDEGLTRELVFQRLDTLGPEGVLELIASGRLPNEIAIELKVPIIWFDEWMQEKVPADRLRKAKQLCAESFALKSVLPLTVTYDSPGHAAMARALSERMVWVAERLDPEKWGPPKPGITPPAPVTFVFEGMTETPKVEVKDAQVVERAPPSSYDLLAEMKKVETKLQKEEEKG